MRQSIQSPSYRSPAISTTATLSVIASSTRFASAARVAPRMRVGRRVRIGLQPAQRTVQVQIGAVEDPIGRHDAQQTSFRARFATPVATLC